MARMAGAASVIMRAVSAASKQKASMRWRAFGVKGSIVHIVHSHLGSYMPEIITAAAEACCKLEPDQPECTTRTH